MLGLKVFSERDRTTPLDGLRGLACLIVLAGHATAFNVPDGQTMIVGVPKIGVWLFFVLSAFLLTRWLIGRGLSAGAIGIYAQRRFFRIVPMFILAVLFYRVFGSLGIKTNAQMWAVLTFQQPAGHLWTIPVELSFYVVLPFLLIPMVRAGRMFGLLGLLIVVAVAAILCPPADGAANGLFLPIFAVPFGAGIAAAWLTEYFPALRIPQPVAWLMVATVVLMAGLSIAGLPDPSRSWLVNAQDVLGPMLALVVLATTGEGLWPKVMSSAPLVFVGRASFSIYLFHWAVCAFSERLPQIVGLPFAIIVSIAIGAAIYILVESRFEALGRKDLRAIFRRGPPETPPAPASGS